MPNVSCVTTSDATPLLKINVAATKPAAVAFDVGRSECHNLTIESAEQLVATLQQEVARAKRLRAEAKSWHEEVAGIVPDREFSWTSSYGGMIEAATAQDAAQHRFNHLSKDGAQRLVLIRVWRFGRKDEAVKFLGDAVTGKVVPV